MPPAPPSEVDSRQSVATQNSFREEMPSSISSFSGRAGVGRLWSRSTGTPETEQLGDMHSFNEEEPSFLQGPLRPPSYYEATSQTDRVPGLGNVVHHIWSPSQGSVSNTATITDGANRAQRSPPPQYSVQPEVFNELSVRSVVPEPEVLPNSGRQPVAQVRPEINASHRLDVTPEDAQRFENRVRQLQRERAMERGEVTVDGTQGNVGDNRRPQHVAPGPRIGYQRRHSSESRTSEQSLQSSEDDYEPPLDDDPSIELVRKFKLSYKPKAIYKTCCAKTNPFTFKNRKYPISCPEESKTKKYTKKRTSYFRMFLKHDALFRTFLFNQIFLTVLIPNENLCTFSRFKNWMYSDSETRSGPSFSKFKQG